MKHFIFVILLLCATFYGQAQNRLPEPPPEGALVYQCAPCGCADDGQYFSEMGNCPSCNMPLNPRVSGLELKTTNIQRPTVGILLFNMADIMDVSGPLSVFEHAGFNVITFAKTNEPLRIGTHLELTPDFTIDNLPKADILVFPGGGLAESNPADQKIIQLIKDRYEETKVLFSVCSGAFFLGEAGILNGQKATTFASLIPRLSENYAKAKILNNVKYTDNGKIVTSAGLSSGIDAAFHVVSKFYGVGRAQEIANHMEYPWKREHDYARSQLADNYLRDLSNLLSLFSTSFFYSQGNNDQWEMKYTLTRQMPAKKIFTIITKELEKKDDWVQTQVSPLSVTGTINNTILGKGKLELRIQQKDGAPVLVVKAERLKKYTPSTF